ncbi:MAG: ABC transporter ATP-binding protein [Ruminococcaceae bacterium]|nr:ABC transporter ATP-binding protein [Oscillospiraceae bacterium]
MKKLFQYMKYYKKESILGPLFKLLEALFELFVPLVVAAIIDRGIAARDTGYIVRMALVLLALGIIGLVCSITAQFFAAKAAVGTSCRLRRSLFAHIQTLSFSDLDAEGTSTLITRLTNDVNQVQTGINLALRLLLRSPFVVFGAMVMAFTIDAESALVFAAVIPVLSVVVFGIMLISIPLYKKVQRNLDGVTETTRETLAGVRVLRAFRMEGLIRREFSERNEALTAHQKFVGRISALMNPVTYVIVNLAVILLIQKGAVQVDRGVLTQGEVVALYNYMSQILVELVKLASLIISITKCIASFNRVEAIIERRPDMTFPETSASPSGSDIAVEFRNVHLTYRNAGDESLTDISFTAKKGETVGIIGGTGSGKTSLVSLIPRFYDATRGEVLVCGIPVTDYTAEDLRKKIGYVLQKAVLFKGTIRDNLRFGKNDATDEEIFAALETAQAMDVVRAKERGLDSMVEQGGRNLSGGQRQRLTIARALVGKPEILILDDSASALDFATDAALRKALGSLDYSPTVFIISQRTSSIRHADKIIVLDDGAICGTGTHDELLDSCEVYREIYNSQYKKEGEGSR